MRDMQDELQRARLALHGHGMGDNYSSPSQRGLVVRAGKPPRSQPILQKKKNKAPRGSEDVLAPALRTVCLYYQLCAPHY